MSEVAHGRGPADSLVALDDEDELDASATGGADEPVAPRFVNDSVNEVCLLCKFSHRIFLVLYNIYIYCMSTYFMLL